MNWQEIQEKYPHRWLVLEAYDAYTQVKFDSLQQSGAQIDFKAPDIRKA